MLIWIDFYVISKKKIVKFDPNFLINQKAVSQQIITKSLFVSYYGFIN